MTTITELVHAGAFIVSDSGGRSYEQKLVASGQDLDAGEVVMLSAGKLVTFDGASASTCLGILVYPVDASAAAVMGTYLAREAEVRAADLTYPAGTRTLTENDLNALGIILR